MIPTPGRRWEEGKLRASAPPISQNTRERCSTPRYEIMATARHIERVTSSMPHGSRSSDRRAARRACQNDHQDRRASGLSRVDNPEGQQCNINTVFRSSTRAPIGIAPALTPGAKSCVRRRSENVRHHVKSRLSDRASARPPTAKVDMATVSAPLACRK